MRLSHIPRLLGATILAASPLAAFAQTATAEDSLFAGEIIVTAQKQEQRLRDVPVTISAITGEQMIRIGVNQFDQLSAFVPGLNIQE
ncbi:MAG: TonB-dependent receptor, partial [Sphingomonadaceae bacterium]